MRTVTFLSGIFLLFAGVWCYANPGATFLSIAFVLGAAMIFSGVSSLAAFIFDHKMKTGDVTLWRLAEGFITLILGFVVSSNQLVTDAMVPVFFGMWILFSGTLRVLASFTLKRAGITTWKWGLTGGVVSIIAGIFAFLHPIVAAFEVVLIIGTFFMLQGINIITAGVHMQGKLKRRGEKHSRKEKEERA